MEQFVITDATAKRRRIYGEVDATDMAHALQLVQHESAWLASLPEYHQMAVQPASALMDGCWREVAPLGPRPASPAGNAGDHVGEAWCRRWARRDNGRWTVVTVSFYLASQRGEVELLREVEQTCCTSLLDVGGTEILSGWTGYWSEQVQEEPSLDGLMRACAALVEENLQALMS